MRPGRVLASDAVLSLRQLRKTEYYSDFLRPQGIAHSLAAVVERSGDVAAFVSFCRSPRRGAWGSGEIELLETLLPHLQRAVRMHRRLGSRRLLHEALVETADRLPWGVIFLGKSGEVVFANQRARALHATLSRVLSVANAGGGVLDDDRGARLVVSVSPLVFREPLALLRERERPVRVVFGVDRDAERLQLARGLAAASSGLGPKAPRRRLTPREREILVLLAAGHTACSTAALLDVSEHTIKTHVKNLYRKLDVSSRADMVRVAIDEGLA